VARLTADVDPADFVTAGGQLDSLLRDGTVWFPIAFVEYVMADVHARLKPDWAEARMLIARRVAAHLVTYSPEQLDAVAGDIAKALRETAQVSPDLFLDELRRAATPSIDRAYEARCVIEQGVSL
jgi:hypothetical protein